jgi:hypothetical protein
MMNVRLDDGRVDAQAPDLDDFPLPSHAHETLKQPRAQPVR